MKNTILLVDDEEVIRFGIRRFFEHHGYEVLEAESCASAVAQLENRRPDLALLDYKLPDGDALELLERLQSGGSHLPTVILTAHGSIDLAVRAIKEGAEQFLTKPVELEALLVIVERALDNRRSRQVERVERTRRRKRALDPFVGSSAAIEDLEQEAHRVLEARSPILIQGETGSGKGVLASWLHRNGPRAQEAFLDLNCAGLSRELAESELFGHARGAFTGAGTQKEGLLETAHRGTVFLDEIGDLDLDVQPKLLKVIEGHEFRRLGETQTRRADLQLIAATHRDLAAMVTEREFREDLYFRLSTFPLRVPSLRERVEDLPVLAQEILDRVHGPRSADGITLSDDALDALQGYGWPGNIRELRNVLERAALLQEGGRIRRRDLRLGGATTPTEPEDESVDSVVRRHIESVLAEVNGNVTAASRRLGMARSTLYQKIKQYELEPSDF